MAICLLSDETNFRTTMIREIRGLKCPSHDRIRDNHHFMYDAIPGCQPTAFTRCLRCGKTKALHKPQK